MSIHVLHLLRTNLSSRRELLPRVLADFADLLDLSAASSRHAESSAAGNASDASRSESRDSAQSNEACATFQNDIWSRSDGKLACPKSNDKESKDVDIESARLTNSSGTEHVANRHR